MARGPQIKKPERSLWRTDFRLGRNIYALLSNDPESPSTQDPLVGVMESTALAEDVVRTHNAVLQRYGYKYPERITITGESQ